MNRLMHRPAALALLLAACAPAAPEVTEEDLATIRSQRAAYGEAVRAGNHDGVAALYAETATIMPSNAPVAHGRMAYRATLDSMPAVGAFTMTNEELTALGGDAVLVTGSYAITMMIPGSDMAMSDTGKFLEVWRRQADGGWLIGWDIWNSDLPLPPPPPPPPARGR